MVFITFLNLPFRRLAQRCKLETWSIKQIGSMAQTEINPAGFNLSTQNSWLTTLIKDTHS